MMELKVVKQRNVFKPHWWQLRLRWRMWRVERIKQSALRKLPPEIRAAYEAAEKEVERRTLFGDD